MLNNIKKIIIKHWRWFLLIAVSMAFFIGSSAFNYLTQTADFIKWSSPDEAANYNFSKLYAREKKFSFFEKYNLRAADIMRPRSYQSDKGVIKPVSFLGLPLIYGKIASLTTIRVLPYLTPFFAALGIIFFYLLIKEIFDREIALFSALVLAVFPPYLYYSSRSLFHNVFFAVLLIASLYFSVKMTGKTAIKDETKKKIHTAKILNYLYAALGGGFLGLAIITRTAELIWLAPVFLLLWLFNIKKVGLLKLVIFLAFLFLALLPAAYWNQALNGSFWRGGYKEMNQSILNITSAGQALASPQALKAETIKNSFNAVKNSVFYFGFMPYKSLKMLYFYYAKMFYWLFWPALLGWLLFMLNLRKWRRGYYAYFLAYIIIFVVLLLYYGSWDFHDNPDPKSRTIGNSYTRYWLPLYLGAMPLAGYFFIKLSKLLRKNFLIYGFRILIIAAIFFVSLKFVIAGSEEGLSQTVKKALAVRSEYEQVMSSTEPNSVVITQYHDKLFFPERKVIVGLFNDDNMTRQYAVLAGYIPVYYYNFTFPEKDLNYLNSKKLVKFGLSIAPVKKVTDSFTLYRISNIKTQNTLLVIPEAEGYRESRSEK